MSQERGWRKRKSWGWQKCPEMLSYRHGNLHIHELTEDVVLQKINARTGGEGAPKASSMAEKRLAVGW